MTILSETTAQIVEKLFSATEQNNVRQILVKQCGNNLPFLAEADEYKLERLRFAVLKLSQGNLDELSHAVRFANEDWRDLLMAAGFGHDVKAHEKWAQSILEIK